MRVFRKTPDFYCYPGMYEKSYLTEDGWKFTKRIKYQADENGEVKIYFEIIERDGSTSWVDSWYFDFDDSSDAVIVECG